MSLFKKSNRKAKNQRARVDHSDEEISHELDSDLSRLNVKNKSIAKIELNNDSSKSNDNFDDIYDTKPKTKSNPKLSFDVEEEGIGIVLEFYWNWLLILLSCFIHNRLRCL